MSLDKAIASGKEHRKQYKDSRAIDWSCRCHGGCDWCRGNRLYRYTKKCQAAAFRKHEYQLETI